MAEFKCFGKNYLYKAFEEIQDEIYNMEVRDDDIWLCTFPRSGTTWTQEAIWLLVNNLDYKKAIELNCLEKFPYLESSMYEKWETISLIDPESMSMFKNSVEYAKCQKGRRVFKTHLAWELLPKQIQTHERKPKIIHVTREPKDVVLSYYHMLTTRDVTLFNETLKDFCENFFNNTILYSPYFHFNRSYEEQYGNCNIMSLKYEDMIADLHSQVEKLSAFLGTGSINDEDMEKLLDFLSFESMKKNPSANQIMLIEKIKKYQMCKNEYTVIRKGKVGSHKEEFSDELNMKFDKWIEENIKEKETLPKVQSACNCLPK